MTTTGMRKTQRRSSSVCSLSLVFTHAFERDLPIGDADVIARCIGVSKINAAFGISLQNFWVFLFDVPRKGVLYCDYQ